MVQLYKHQTGSQMSVLFFHTGQALFSPAVKTPGFPDLKVFSLKRSAIRARLAPSLDFRFQQENVLF